MNTPPNLLPCPPKEALLNCPFCGDQAEYALNTLFGDQSMAQCRSCGATAFWKKWNTRHSASTVDVEEALRVQKDVGLYEALKWIAAFKTSGPYAAGQIKNEHRAIIQKARAALSTFESSRLGVRNG